MMIMMCKPLSYLLPLNLLIRTLSNMYLHLTDEKTEAQSKNDLFTATLLLTATARI